jgi:serine/threonine protein kinase/thioredoxin-like negative regulator of GroEL
MRPEEWQRCVEIFSAALERQPEERAAFIYHACPDDESLRREVTMLLRSHEESGDFISVPAFVAAAELLDDDPDALIGTQIGPYRVESVLGSGGMGVVYLAHDERLGRKVGLKLLPQSLIADITHLSRLKREARTASALNHPNIVTIHDIGEDHSTHYIASELIEGETLRERLMRGPIQLSEAVDIATQVAGALVAAHDAGVVHRDIKPENIMLRPDGYVKVVDFGIAKLAEQEMPAMTLTDDALSVVETNLGSILGTARYMSPEQARGAPVDKRTDIWSLGVVLYEMVTGHAPFTGDTPRDMISSILEKEPPPLTNYVPHTSTQLQQIIGKALCKDREQRYRSAHELLEGLKRLRHKLEFEFELQRSSAARSWLHRKPALAALLLLLLVVVLALALPFYWHRNPTTSASQKSIAVLPFENLNKDEENAFFAGGVQDEILSDLAKIADLKVISRTSVMQYKSGPERNLREIAKVLGVSHVVEGSVQRVGGRVRVSAQLIDARSDAHLWAEHYDRDVADVFAVQSEIAQQIADQLKVNLSPAEKAAIAERPTADPVAYALYTKAKEIEVWGNWEGADKSLNRKVELLEKATQRDPNFALAYCTLAETQTDLFMTSSEDHLGLAKKAADVAVRVQPDLAEAHLELARYYYYAGLHASDFERARDELTIARRKLPNNSEALLIEARIDKRQNRWDASLAKLQKASELDPRNNKIALFLTDTYFEMRRYSELAQRMTKEPASGAPEEAQIKHVLADIKLAQGDPVAAQSLLDEVPLDYSPRMWIWDTRFKTALYLRDYDGANRVIAATPAKWARVFSPGHPPESLGDGLVARARGDKQTALSVFAVARKRLDATWEKKVKDDSYFINVAILDAGLGRKEEAIHEALRAVDLMPIAKDSQWGPRVVSDLALVYAWTGERDRALEQLETVATIPNGPTYGDLRFNPCWDDLRDDPRFDKIVAAAKAASR